MRKILCLIAVIYIVNYAEAQQCDLILAALKRYAHESQKTFIISNQVDQKKCLYNMQLSQFKDSMSHYVSKDVINQAIKEVYTEQNPISHCTNKRLKFIDSVTVDSVLNRTGSDMELLEKFPIEQYVVYFVAKPLVFSDYVVIEIAEFVTRRRVQTDVLLFKKQGSKYKFIKVLMNSAG